MWYRPKKIAGITTRNGVSNFTVMVRGWALDSNSLGTSLRDRSKSDSEIPVRQPIAKCLVKERARGYIPNVEVFLIAPIMSPCSLVATCVRCR
jgi:hypothetical protein